MPSFLLPKNIVISQSPGYIKLEGPFGSCIKKTGEFSFYIIQSSEGSRLFSNMAATGLSALFQLSRGLVYGFRQRLRLTGIGFRGYITQIKNESLSIKGYRRKRLSTTSSSNILIMKIGFSHEIVYRSASNQQVDVNVSRLDGRTKGTLLYLKSNNLSHLKQAAAEIRAFRFPDVYKGKGIYYDNQKIKIKKGKRQGLLDLKFFIYNETR